MNRIEQIPEFEVIREAQLAYQGMPLHDLEEKRGKIAEVQYARGFLLPHRGYFCPSLIQDIVIGNARRGRLIRHPRKASIPEYTYGFDLAGKLICVEKEVNFEWIFYEADRRQVGLTFFKRNASIIDVSVCQYDEQGRLLSYLYGYSYTLNGTPMGIWSEYYQYDAGQMNVTMYDYFQSGKNFIAKQERYCFTLENGVLKSYHSLSEAPERELPVHVDRDVFQRFDQIVP